MGVPKFFDGTSTITEKDYEDPWDPDYPVGEWKLWAVNIGERGKPKWHFYHPPAIQNSLNAQLVGDQGWVDDTKTAVIVVRDVEYAVHYWPERRIWVQHPVGEPRRTRRVLMPDDLKADKVKRRREKEEEKQREIEKEQQDWEDLLRRSRDKWVAINLTPREQWKPPRHIREPKYHYGFVLENHIGEILEKNLEDPATGLLDETKYGGWWKNFEIRPNQQSGWRKIYYSPKRKIWVYVIVRWTWADRGDISVPEETQWRLQPPRKYKTRRRELRKKKQKKKKRTNEQCTPVRVECVTCGAEASNICIGCDEVYYCGTDCQKEDWLLHKPSCLTTERQ